VVIFYIAVLTINYRRSKDMLMHLPFFRGEKIENLVRIPGFAAHKQMLLSNYRLAELAIRWPFSLKSFRVSDLDTCDSYMTRHMLNPLLFLVGFCVYLLLSPLAGYLLMLYSAVAYLIRVSYSFKHFGSSLRVNASTSLPFVVGRLWGFSLSTERVRRSIKLSPNDPLSLTGVSEYQTSSHFRYDPAFRVVIAWCIFVAIVQRLAKTYISIDDDWFGPFYLAAPLAAGIIMKPRHAMLAGLFGFWAIFGVACPLTAGHTWSYAAGVPFDHFLLLSVGFAAMAVVASLIARAGFVPFAPAAALLWPIVVAVAAPKTLADLSLFGQTFLGAGLGAAGSFFAAPSRLRAAEPEAGMAVGAGDRACGDDSRPCD